jgi:two-component system phosphate regulon sensor histidine kinase PhoR
LHPRAFWKLGLSYLALLLAALAFLYFYTLRTWERSVVDEAYEHLDGIARLAETNPPGAADGDSLGSWVQWVAESGVRATLVAEDGRVLADSSEDPARMENHGSRPEIAAAWKEGRGRAARFSQTVKRELAYLAVRVGWRATGPSVLRVAIPLRKVSGAIQRVRAPLVGILLVTFLVGPAAAVLASRSFSDRVARLKAFLRRVAQGDYRPEPVDGKRDELSELHRSLNETVERLGQSMRFLEDERNLSAAVLGSMSEGVAVVDREERIRYSNPAFLQALDPGGSRDLEGLRLVETTRQEEILAMVRSVLSGGERREAEIATAGLKPKHFLVRAAPAGERGAVLVVLDITEIRRLERVRRDFVANVSHEIRTPLTAIQGFAETLLQGALQEPENSRRFVTIIRDHSARLARLTEDLLKLSRIEAGKLELDLYPVDVLSVADKCVETVRRKLSQKNQSLSLSSDDPPPLAIGDANAIYDVLLNLLDNASQYTPEKGRIAIRIARADGPDFPCVRISVEDDGIGIPASAHDRIFERFYRVDAARSREVGGTGLGLSISKHLVESMGGRIELESQLGRGSTFTVVLRASPG